MNVGLPSIRCPLTKAADDAISLFGDENAESVVPLRDGRFKTTGTAIDTILPPVRRFGGARAEKKAGVIEKLKTFFATFMGLVEE